MTQKIILFILVVSLFLLAGCVKSTAGTPSSVTQSLMGTAVAQTVVIQQTIFYLETVVVQLTQAAHSVPSSTLLSPSSTPVVVTITPQPPTNTSVPPSSTPIPQTTTPLPPTSTPIPCDALQFVADMTIPDGTILSAGQSFVKTWRIKNSGTCGWTPTYSLVFVSGNSMNGPTSVNLNASVSPGSTIDLSITLVSPSSGGTHTGNWQLRNANGILFGFGPNANKPFWVKIVIPTATTNSNNAINFGQQYCTATWTTPLGTLPCPSTTNDFIKGSITLSKKPQFETGYIDDQATLIMIPTNGNGGLIQGRYPPMLVKSGDEFSTWIGCMYESDNCNVIFELNYIADGGAVQNLGTWTQTYDNSIEEIKINLNALAGKSVEFILLVTNNNSSNKDDRAFWLYPRIVR